MSCRWLAGLNWGRPTHTSVMRRMISSGASVLETNPSAPALMARSTVPLGLNDVSISTCGGRGSARSLLVVSMPSMPGMAISINATSG